MKTISSNEFLVSLPELKYFYESNNIAPVNGISLPFIPTEINAAAPEELTTEISIQIIKILTALSNPVGLATFGFSDSISFLPQLLKIAFQPENPESGFYLVQNSGTDYYLGFKTGDELSKYILSITGTLNNDQPVFSFEVKSSTLLTFLAVIDHRLYANINSYLTHQPAKYSVNPKLINERFKDRVYSDPRWSLPLINLVNPDIFIQPVNIPSIIADAEELNQKKILVSELQEDGSTLLNLCADFEIFSYSEWWKTKIFVLSLNGELFNKKTRWMYGRASDGNLLVLKAEASKGTIKTMNGKSFSKSLAEFFKFPIEAPKVEVKEDRQIQFKFCPNCGAKLEQGIRFCGECGFKLF